MVGDDDQSIYGWRGADLRNILEFQRDFPAARLVRLEENYRSTRPILEAANSVIAAQLGPARQDAVDPARRAASRSPWCAPPTSATRPSGWCASSSTRARSGEHGFGEMAVLLRTNAQTRAFEEELRRCGVPYRVVGAVSFYERREVKDLLALPAAGGQPATTTQAFRRAVAVPRRGIGETEPGGADPCGDAVGLVAVAHGRGGRPACRSCGPRRARAWSSSPRDLDAMRAELARLQPAEALRGDRRAHRVTSAYLLEEDETGPERVENVTELLNAAAAWSEEWGARAGRRGRQEDAPIERFLAADGAHQRRRGGARPRTA